MKITARLADPVVLQELGLRLRRHRLQRRQTQQALADEAGVSKRTVERIEAGESAQLASFVRICRALDFLEHFEALVPEPLPSPMEQLALRGKQRQRAPGRRTAKSSTGPRWSWGEDE